MSTTTHEARTATSAARLAGWTGLAFTVSSVAGFLLVGQVPAYDAPDASWVSWVEDSDSRVQTVISTMLLSAAGLLLMAFTAGLAAHVRGGSAGAASPLVGVLRGAGVMAGTSVLLAALTSGAMSAGVTFAPDFPAPGADVLRTLDQLGIAFLLIGAGWSAAVVIACACREAARTGTLPGWLTSAGWVVAVALLVSFLFLPILLLPLWVGTTGAVLLGASRTSTT